MGTLCVVRVRRGRLERTSAASGWGGDHLPLPTLIGNARRRGGVGVSSRDWVGAGVGFEEGCFTFRLERVAEQRELRPGQSR